MLDSRLPIGDCFIRPVDAGVGLSVIRPPRPPGGIPPIPLPPSFPVGVGNSGEIWHTIKDQNGNFKVLSGRAVTKPVEYRWVKEGNALYATWFDVPGDSFRIEPAGPDAWFVGIPGQDLLLTFHGVNAYPQLTFDPPDGSSAQRFVFKPLLG